jgi:hypothetical protein
MEHWKAVPLMTAFKLIRFWLPDYRSQNKKFVLMNFVLYGPFLVLLIVAAIRRIRGPQWEAAWTAADLIMLAGILSAAIFYADARFRDSNFPLLTLYAAMALPGISRRWLFLDETSR